MGQRTAKRSVPTEEGPRRAVIYARVSSKEQDREGYSIPAQLKLLQEYARSKGLVVVQEFVDTETAKATGRTNFGAMMKYLAAGSNNCRSSWSRKPIASTGT